MGKTFPVICRFSQYSRQQQIRLEVLTPRAVPWDFIAPHEAQAQRNHDQSLERLAQRGGLSPYEMVMCVRGRGLDGCTEYLARIFLCWIQAPDGGRYPAGSVEAEAHVRKFVLQHGIKFDGPITRAEVAALDAAEGK